MTLKAPKPSDEPKAGGYTEANIKKWQGYYPNDILSLNSNRVKRWFLYQNAIIPNEGTTGNDKITEKLSGKWGEMQWAYWLWEIHKNVYDTRNLSYEDDIGGLPHPDTGEIDPNINWISLFDWILASRGIERTAIATGIGKLIMDKSYRVERIMKNAPYDIAKMLQQKNVQVAPIDVVYMENKMFGDSGGSDNSSKQHDLMMKSPKRNINSLDGGYLMNILAGGVIDKSNSPTNEKNKNALMEQLYITQKEQEILNQTHGQSLGSGGVPSQNYPTVAEGAKWSTNIKQVYTAPGNAGALGDKSVYLFTDPVEINKGVTRAMIYLLAQLQHIRITNMHTAENSFFEVKNITPTSCIKITTQDIIDMFEIGCLIYSGRSSSEAEETPNYKTWRKNSGTKFGIENLIGKYDADKMQVVKAVDIIFTVVSMIPTIDDANKEKMANKSVAVSEDDVFAAFNDHNANKANALKKIAKSFTPSNKTAGQEERGKKEELRKNIHQCILLAAMPELEKLSIGMRTGRQSNGIKVMNDGEHPIPWGGRILPITVTPMQNTMNALTLIPTSNISSGAGINEYLKSGNSIVRGLVTTLRISKVVKNFYAKVANSSSNKKVLVNAGKEVKLPLAFGMAELVKGPKGEENIGESIFLPNEVSAMFKGEQVFRENMILLKSINVDFKGGNMATSKSDVEVKIELTIPDITTLQQHFKGIVEFGNKRYEYTYSVLDLLTYTNNNSPTGFASIFRGQYHPDYNRLLLESHITYQKPLNVKSAPESASALNGALKQMPLHLDMAVVDHEIKKDDKTNQATISISYRGYIDSSLTDPSCDALAGPDIMEERLAREIILQDKIGKKQCSLYEVRNDIRKYNLQLGRDSYKTIPRILDTLSKHDKIFKVGCERSAVRAALSWAGDSIARPWHIVNSMKKKDNLDIDKTIKQWILFNWKNKASWEGMTEEQRTKAREEWEDKCDETKMFSNTIQFQKTFLTFYHQSGAKKGTIKKKYKPAKNWLQKAQNQKLRTMRFDDIKFFFFGDLVDVLLDCVHFNAVFETGEKTYYTKNRNLRTKFDKMFSYPLRAKETVKNGYYFAPDPFKIVLSSFKWYMPTEPDAKGSSSHAQYVTNLADVPVGVDWFTHWFRQEIIEKKLSYYPIASFIKKLAQTLITRLLGDVCFDVGSDRKVLFRASMDTGLWGSKYNELDNRRKNNKPELIEKWYKTLKSDNHKKEKGCLVLDYNSVDGLKMMPVYKKALDGTQVEWYKKHHYLSYITLYPANATGIEYKTKEEAAIIHQAGVPEFKQKGFVPSVVNGNYKNELNGIVQSMAFTKKDAPYRREVKFFASKQGNLAQISGVYNVKIKLVSGAYFLFPGQLIWVDAGMGDEPNNVKSLAFTLGIGGYYQIISVNHKITYHGAQSPVCSTSLEAAWVNFGVKHKDDLKAAFFRGGVKKKSGHCQEVEEGEGFRDINLKNFRDKATRAIDKGETITEPEVPAGQPGGEKDVHGDVIKKSKLKKPIDKGWNVNKTITFNHNGGSSDAGGATYTLNTGFTSTKTWREKTSNATISITDDAWDEGKHHPDGKNVKIPNLLIPYIDIGGDATKTYSRTIDKIYFIADVQVGETFSLNTHPDNVKSPNQFVGAGAGKDKYTKFTGYFGENELLLLIGKDDRNQSFLLWCHDEYKNKEKWE